ncbi:molybdopterin-containing oxidoreductase family iron-sulfur binding subunit [Rhodoligotrophos appendicifer]|uniref:TAT-variant-translocated molybdopterin oxidoreductase n=1 Tax=Rhodoligotrophos appendicifer TaxID=987056 RepID=UPI00118498B4|nr:TAT-variant-translocated molybdopterin oxidoreductase [Rhodoligotrophos appendicifer]
MPHRDAGTSVHRLRDTRGERTGPRFWRSPDELAQSPDFRAFLEAEFPSSAPAGADVDRRAVLKAMAASLALTGLAGCSAEADDNALPYVNAPEFVIPGVPRMYATAVTLSGYAQPAIGKTYVGRPVKLEGNDEHPATRGATDPFLQAAILGLYDPERSQSPLFLGRATAWEAFDATMMAQAGAHDGRRGEGFRLLTGAVTSPTMLRQIDELMARWPMARWHVTEPVNQASALAATREVFGRPLDHHLQLDRAELVISFDHDVLGPGPCQAVHGRRWSDRRLAAQQGHGGSRLFVAEPSLSITGSRAEDHLITRFEHTGKLVYALAAAVGVAGAKMPELTPPERVWLERIADALDGQAGRALVTVGPQHSTEIHAWAILINERIGALGKTLLYTDPIATAPPDGERSLEALVSEMAAGRVTTLAMIDVNPVYATPADLGFAAALDKVGLRIHAGLHADETAALCHWHLPLQHELESWSDARAVDGTVSIIQPLVRPFYAVRSLHSVLQNLSGSGSGDRDIVTSTWRAEWGQQFEANWAEALVRGFVPDSAAPLIAPDIATRSINPPSQVEERGLALVIRPDPTIWDGRFATNAWLQETPKPLTKITWGNAILISPQLATARGITNGDELCVEADGQTVTGGAWVMPGQEPNTVLVTLGYGRSRATLANDLGVNAYALCRQTMPWYVGGVTLTATGERQVIASTQLHQAMDGFDFVRVVDRARPDATKQRTVPGPEDAHQNGAWAPTFYPVREWDSPSWGMSIDLDLCIGCNACVVACVAENNVPVVGKELVAQGREMHWLRVDHYFEGDPEAPRSHFQPVPCMHCEQAPCEMGCPVNATVHSSDGLNLQVYNRCIGTRTCSSYCPYKVRRFNWFDFTGDDPESMRAMRNPDVTVRSRGVMEKCTYCVQRISEARIAAKKEGREFTGGEVTTACQQACPTKAIVFGNVEDPASEVSGRKASPRDYSLLEEANTWPRTTYLARIEDRGGSGTQ